MANPALPGSPAPANPAPSSATGGPSDDADAAQPTPTPTLPFEPSATMAQVAGRSPYQRGFGPLYPDEPPAGRLVRLDGAWMTRDRQTVFASFIGGHAFDVTSACTQDYGGWADGSGDALEIAIVVVDHPEAAKLGPNMACTLEGYGYIAEFRLPEPFRGSAVRDRAVGPIWVAPPDGVADVAALPRGWWLSRVSSEGSIHEISREFHPDPADPGQGDRFISLMQTFGAPSDVQIDPVATVSIGGVDVPIGRNGPDGWMVSWRLGADGLTLIAYGSQFSMDQVVAMANSVAVPSP